jgi:hypothetical protein
MGPADGKAYNLISDNEAIGLGLRATKAGARLACSLTVPIPALAAD